MITFYKTSLAKAKHSILKFLWLTSLLILFGFSCAQVSSNTEIVILGFEVDNLNNAGSVDGYGGSLVSLLQSEFTNSSRFTVLDRSILNEINNEIALGEEGLVSPEEAKKFGEFSNADYFITGKVLVYAQDNLEIITDFIEVSTSKVIHSIRLRASGPEAFVELAQALVQDAEERFPLISSIRRQDGEYYVMVGSDQGISTDSTGGRIIRSVELFGILEPRAIGTFEIVPTGIFTNATEISINLEAEFSLEDADYAEFYKQSDAPSTVQEIPKGQLSVRGNPIGAEVYFQDVYLGVLGSDELLIPLEIGEGILEVRSQNFATDSRRIAILENQILPLTINLSPLEALLTLDISESRFEAFLNGINLGQTTQFNLPPGIHNIRVLSEGNEPFEQEFSVSAGEQKNLIVNFTPLKAILNLTILPETAIVRINGQIASSSESLLLDAGNYNLSIEADGFESQELNLSLSAGQTLNEVLNLQAIEVNTPPAVVTEQPGSPLEAPEVNPQPPTTAIPEDGTSTTSESTTQENGTTIKANEGWLNITSNTANAEITLVPLLGGEDILLQVSENQLQFVIVEGFYDIFASANGAQSYRDAIDIRPGIQNNLTLSFESLKLETNLYLGTLNNFGYTDILIAGKLSEIDFQAIQSLSISGPEGWNENQALELGVDYLDILEWWGPELVTGEYSLSYKLSSGLISQTFFLDPQDILAEVKRIDVDARNANSLKLSWLKVNNASYYFIDLFQEETYLGGTETASLSTVLQGVNLEAQETYDICVTALNWQPGTEAPTDQLKGSFVCETFIAPQQTNSDTSNNPPATPSDDEVSCPECDDF